MLKSRRSGRGTRPTVSSNLREIRRPIRSLRLLRPEALEAVSMLAAGGSVNQVARSLDVHRLAIVRLVECARFYHRGSRLVDLRALPDRSPAGIADHLMANRRWPK